MKKAVVTFLVLGIIAGAGYGAYRTGYLQKYTGKYLGKWIPALAVEETEGEGRISSTAEDAVYLDKVSVLMGLTSGDGLLEKFSGKVEPQETKKYSIASGRTVDKTYVQEGDEVKKGDRLFTYDVDSMKDKLEQAKIDLERLQNSVDVSEAKAQELEKQLQNANTPEKKLQALEEQNSLKQEKLELKSKKNTIDSINDQIKNSTVVSDIDGIVKTVNQNMASGSDDGNYGDNSDSSYITLLKVGTYRVKASCNEQNIKAIMTGERVLVYSRIDDSQIWKGTISEIKTDQPSGDSESQDSMMQDSGSGSSSYPFYVELDSSDGLMLGQHVYLEQDIGQADRKPGIWLEDYYFETDDDGSSYVWAAASDNTLEKRKVTLGETDEESGKVNVSEGLSEDDYICQPADNLKEGLPVAYNDETSLPEGGEEYLYEETDAYDGSYDPDSLGLDEDNLEGAYAYSADYLEDDSLSDDSYDDSDDYYSEDAEGDMIPIDETEG